MRTMFRRFTHRHKRRAGDAQSDTFVNYEGEAVDGTLTVEVLYGENLQNTDWLKNSDPYCVVHAAGRSFPTAVRRREGSHPKWFQSIGPFDIYPTTQKVRFEIFDEDRLKKKDDMVGWAEVNLCEARRLFTTQAALPVFTSKSKAHGLLHVKLIYSPASNALVQMESLDSAPSSTLLSESITEEVVSESSSGRESSSCRDGSLQQYGRMNFKSLEGWDPNNVLIRDVRKLRKDLEQRLRTEVRHDISVIREKQDSLLLNQDLDDVQRDEMQHKLNHQLKRLLSMQKVLQYGIRELQGIESLIRENGLVDPEIVDPLQIYVLREIVTNLDIMTYAPNKVQSVTAKTREVVEEHKAELDAADGLSKLQVWLNILSRLNDNPTVAPGPQFTLAEHRRAWSEPPAAITDFPSSTPDAPGSWSSQPHFPQHMARRTVSSDAAPTFVHHTSHADSAAHSAAQSAGQQIQPSAESATSPFSIAQSGDRNPFEIVPPFMPSSAHQPNQSSSSVQDPSASFSPFLMAQSDGKMPFEIVPIPEEDEEEEVNPTPKSQNETSTTRGSWSITTQLDASTTADQNAQTDTQNALDLGTASGAAEQTEVWISPFLSAQSDGQLPFETEVQSSPEAMSPAIEPYPIVQHASSDVFPFTGHSRSAQLPVQLHSFSSDDSTPTPSPFRSAPIGARVPSHIISEEDVVSQSAPVAAQLSPHNIAEEDVVSPSPHVGAPDASHSIPEDNVTSPNAPVAVPAASSSIPEDVLSPFESTQAVGFNVEVAVTPEAAVPSGPAATGGPLGLTETEVLPPVMSAGLVTVIDKDCLPWPVEDPLQVPDTDLLSPFKSAQLDDKLPFETQGVSVDEVVEDDAGLDSPGPLQQSRSLDDYLQDGAELPLVAEGVGVGEAAEDLDSSGPLQQSRSLDDYLQDGAELTSVPEGVRVEEAADDNAGLDTVGPLQQSHSLDDYLQDGVELQLVVEEVLAARNVEAAASVIQEEEEAPRISPFKSAQLDGKLLFEGELQDEIMQDRTSPSSVEPEAEQDTYISPFKSAQLDGKAPFEEQTQLDVEHAAEEDDYIPLVKSEQLVEGATSAEIASEENTNENAQPGMELQQEGDSYISPFRSVQLDGKAPFEENPQSSVEPEEDGNISPLKSVHEEDQVLSQDIIGLGLEPSMEEDTYISPFKSAQLDGKAPYEAQLHDTSKTEEDNSISPVPDLQLHAETAVEVPSPPDTGDQPEEDGYISPFMSAQLEGQAPFEVQPVPNVPPHDSQLHRAPSHPTSVIIAAVSQATDKTPALSNAASIQSPEDAAHVPESTSPESASPAETHVAEPVLSPFASAQLDGQVPFEVTIPDAEDWVPESSTEREAGTSVAEAASSVRERSDEGPDTDADQQILAWISSTAPTTAADEAKEEEEQYISPFLSAQLDGRSPFEAGASDEGRVAYASSGGSQGGAEGSYRSPFSVAQVEYEREHPSAVLMANAEYVYSPFKTAQDNGYLPFESVPLGPLEVDDYNTGYVEISSRDRTVQSAQQGNVAAGAQPTGSSPFSAAQAGDTVPFEVVGQEQQEEGNSAVFSPFSAAQAGDRAPFEVADQTEEEDSTVFSPFSAAQAGGRAPFEVPDQSEEEDTAVFSPFSAAQAGGKAPFEVADQHEDVTCSGSSPFSAAHAGGHTPFHQGIPTPSAEDEDELSPLSGERGNTYTARTTSGPASHMRESSRPGASSGIATRTTSGPPSSNTASGVDVSRLLMFGSQRAVGSRSFKSEVSSLVTRLRNLLQCPEGKSDE